jgi:hypothetical protein
MGSPKKLKNVEQTYRHGKFEKGIIQFIDGYNRITA